MYVTNDQPCTLIVGGVRIQGGESKKIPSKWDDRCRELAGIGAMRVSDDKGPVLKPAKERAADILRDLSPEDRAELIRGIAAPDAPLSRDPIAGAPDDFATWHWTRAKAWVGDCNDRDVLEALGNVESRNTVLQAIIDRIGTLDSLAS